MLYQPAAAGDTAFSCFFSSSSSPSMSSYFSHGGSSSTSSPTSSFSAALGAAPVQPSAPLLQPAIADPAAHFDISEYLFDDGVFTAPPPPVVVPDGGAAGAGTAEAPAVAERPRTERIAFRTRSEIEVLDDGYKWRKYGKKSVKSSPNPR